MAEKAKETKPGQQAAEPPKKPTLAEQVAACSTERLCADLSGYEAMQDKIAKHADRIALVRAELKRRL